ncbi:MAG: ATP-grasp domain-containing protein [Muribaculaceae bacterium]|nr:ATP-grasp domain-containing protein [Muribaculaceae bacterium]
MATVLVIESGTQGLSIIRALNKAGHKVVLFYSEKSNYGGLSRYIYKKCFVHNEPKSEEYYKNLCSTIRDEHIDMIIPMGDKIAELLCLQKDKLLNFTKFDAPDYDDFLRGYDKNKLMSLCKRNGFPHPETLDMSIIKIEESQQLKNFPYPAMLKPNLTTGGRGMVKVDNYEQLKKVYPSLQEQYGDYHLQQFINPGGRQVKVQLYINSEKELVASSVIEKKRWYPVQGGSNCCAVTIKDNFLVDMCYHVLLDLNWLGFADFDLIEDPDTNQLLIMEINPRVPACIKSPIAAGLNWGQVFVDSCLGKSKQEYSYKEGVVLRHLGFDVLWFMKSPNRWRSKPSWFKFFGKNVYYQDMSDWTDPQPFFGGTWNNIKKLFTGHAK